MQVSRFTLNPDLWQEKRHLPRDIYIFTSDNDASVRIYKRGHKHAIWKIYKSFDDAADMINRMTKDNLYELTSSSKMAPSPWETWADRHISVRYALDAYSKKQLKDIRHYDRWHKHAGLILKGHYAYKQPLFA